MSCGRTGALGSSRPVASRIAATTAATEEIMGGSPAPFAPMGEPGSGSSIKAAMCTGGMSSAVGIT